MKIFIQILLLMVFGYSFSYADYIPREDKQKQYYNYKLQIEKYEASSVLSNKNISSLNLKLKDIINQIKVLSDLISDMKSGASPNKTIKQEIEFIQRKESIEKLKNEFKKRIIALYKKGVNYQYQILFSSESPSKFYARLEYLTKLSQTRKVDFEKIKYEEFAFLESKKISGLNKTELGKYLSLKKQDHSSLLEEKSAIEDSLSLLRSNIDNYNYQIDKLRSRLLDLEYYLSTNNDNTVYKIMSTPNYSSDNFELLKGKLIFPVNSTDIVNDFGKSVSPLTGTVVNNEGIDVSISENSDVRCVADGIIENVFDVPLYRRIIIVSHNNGYRSVYGVVNNLYVSRGSVVKAGQVIARSSQTLDGQLFHFEIRKNLIPEDPKYWVARIQ
ncbi:MAG: peptidoglycan DD-metalloendopeptidase family protein [Ignavibacteriota bacterium]|nr:peptidoglycan DD-metalloendopeptidase family protein [Ignavibacteriota bacterium]